MLQVSTGKFFTTSNLHETPQQAILYTNYEVFVPCITVAGTLQPLGFQGEVRSTLYTIIEKLERQDAQGGAIALVAVGIEPYLQDFAVLTSFALNALFSPEAELVRRLTSKRSIAMGIRTPPSGFVPRFFDAQIPYEVGTDVRLAAFFDKIMGLERKTYEVVSRAIRRFITGLHRIGDDLDLAYTLMVAALESFAQSHDPYVASWEDYPAEKRRRVDTALEGATADVASGVREAILENEHLALQRRFVAFVSDHLPEAYFREGAHGVAHPVQRRELGEVLEAAYRIRSRYVHTLTPLPKVLTLGEPFTIYEVVSDAGQDNRRMLTLRGLTRLAHQVISEVIDRGTHRERETFDYRTALPNVLQVRMDAQYWLWNAEGFSLGQVNTYLNGLFEKLNDRMMGGEPQLPDMTAVLEKIKALIPGVGEPQRRGALALYLLYNTQLKPDLRHPGWEVFYSRYKTCLLVPCLESLALTAFGIHLFDWDLTDFEATWQTYFKQRAKKNALVLPKPCEACLALMVARIYERDADPIRVALWVSEAVELLPGHQSLITLEQKIRSGEALNIESYEFLWRSGVPDDKPPLEEARLETSDSHISVAGDRVSGDLNPGVPKAQDTQPVAVEERPTSDEHG